MLSKNTIKLIRQLEQKKHRLRTGLFVAEGPKVVGDLLLAGMEPEYLMATDMWMPPVGHEHTTAPGVFTLVSDEELQKLSFLQHPQQVLAVLHIPSAALAQEYSLPREADSPTLPRLVLALDGVQDPGNLGTIIRLADWFGISLVVCSPDTADAWSPKVVQATMGSIARVKLVYTDLKEYLNSSPLPVCGTLLDGDDIYSTELPREAIIVMGNEGNGISTEIRQLVSKPLLIPRFQPGAESLNVAIATAITCAEFRRRTHVTLS